MSGTMLAEGKTKRVLAGEVPHTVVLQAIDRLTGGDAARVAGIDAIGRAKTRQAANAFRLLAEAGVPTAFLDQVAEDALLCRACEMVPLELVVRRYAYGSYLKRHPEAAGDPPRRFETPVWEVFHKRALVMPPHVPEAMQMDEGAARDAYLKDGIWAEGVFTDPYIDTSGPRWGLHSAKAPLGSAPLATIAPTLAPNDLTAAIETLILPVFAVLEAAWARIETAAGPVRLADIKLEIGRDAETGRMLLADVIDNDSWRVWPGGDPTLRLDKQAFRDGAPESEVSANYELVARLTDRFVRQTRP